MHQPATTNPMIIMVINMTIVFAVLIGLSFMIKSVVTPAAPAVDQNLNIAVIAAAVAAYGGDAKIVAIRPVESTGWKNVGRANGVQNTVF